MFMVDGHLFPASLMPLLMWCLFLIWGSVKNKEVHTHCFLLLHLGMVSCLDFSAVTFCFSLGWMKTWMCVLLILGFQRKSIVEIITDKAVPLSCQWSGLHWKAWQTISTRRIVMWWVFSIAFPFSAVSLAWEVCKWYDVGKWEMVWRCIRKVALTLMFCMSAMQS